MITALELSRHAFVIDSGRIVLNGHPRILPTTHSSGKPISGVTPSPPGACYNRKINRLLQFHASPWTYLGHQRFLALARRFSLAVRHKPMDLLKVWSVSGGLPLKQRAQQRQPPPGAAALAQLLAGRAISTGLSSRRRPPRLLPRHRGDAAGTRLGRLSDALLRAVWVGAKHRRSSDLGGDRRRERRDGEALWRGPGRRGQCTPVFRPMPQGSFIALSIFANPYPPMCGWAVFRGQERIDMLEWRLKQKLVRRRGQGQDARRAVRTTLRARAARFRFALLRRQRSASIHVALERPCEERPAEDRPCRGGSIRGCCFSCVIREIALPSLDFTIANFSEYNLELFEIRNGRADLVLRASLALPAIRRARSGRCGASIGS